MSDPFEQIGPKLREAREEMGLSLEEAATQAQVPKSAAEALEVEDFTYFDSPVYAKSFLLQYSEFLGVDAHTWLDALEPGSFIASGTLLKGPEPPARRAETTEPQTRGGGMAVIVLLLVTAAIVYAVIKGFEYFESRQNPTPPAQESSSSDPSNPEGSVPDGPVHSD